MKIKQNIQEGISNATLDEVIARLESYQEGGFGSRKVSITLNIVGEADTEDEDKDEF